MILYADGNIKSYVLTKNNNVIILNGKRESFRCKQRDESDNHESFKFISYKKMLKEAKRNSHLWSFTFTVNVNYKNIKKTHLNHNPDTLIIFYPLLFFKSSHSFVIMIEFSFIEKHNIHFIFFLSTDHS